MDYQWGSCVGEIRELHAQIVKHDLRLLDAFVAYNDLALTLDPLSASRE